MRLFGSDNISGIMERLGLEEDQPIEHRLITRAIENAQRKVEARNFSIRKRLLEYDDVINKQREVIYQQRRDVLEGRDLKDNILAMTGDVVDNLLDSYCNRDMTPDYWDLPGLLTALEQSMWEQGFVDIEEIKGIEREDLHNLIMEKAKAYYQQREEAFGEEAMREMERVVILRVVDSKWMEHLDVMDSLREGIGLRAYGQRDPLTEYKHEAYQMFQGLIARIREDIVRYAFKVNVHKQPQRRQQAVVTGEQGDKASPAVPVRREGKKIGRNDPCPCGSGKKYKRCCGKN